MPKASVKRRRPGSQKPLILSGMQSAGRSSPDLTRPHATQSYTYYPPTSTGTFPASKPIPNSQSGLWPKTVYSDTQLGSMRTATRHIPAQPMPQPSRDVAWSLRGNHTQNLHHANENLLTGPGFSYLASLQGYDTPAPNPFPPQPQRELGSFSVNNSTQHTWGHPRFDGPQNQHMAYYGPCNMHNSNIPCTPTLPSEEDNYSSDIDTNILSREIPPTPPLSPKPPPKSINEAISRYIEFLIQDNERKTQISEVQFHDMPSAFEDDPFYEELLVRTVGFPTDRLHKWLQLRNVDIEVSDTNQQQLIIPSKGQSAPAIPDTDNNDQKIV